MALTRPMESRSAGQHPASGMEFALTGTTHGKELESSSGWTDPPTDSETESPACKNLVSSLERSRKSDREILRQLALENFATRVESGLKSLWKVLRDSSSGVSRADELVAEMKEQFQCLEESLAPGGVPHGIDNTQEFGAPGLTNGKEAVRPSTMSPKEAVKPTGKHVSVKSEFGTGEPSLEFTSIFVGGIPMTMTVDKLRVVLGAKFEAAIIERYHEKAKVGHAKVHILMRRFGDDELDQGLELESPVTGQSLRIARWQSSKAPAPAVARAKNRWSRRSRQATKSEEVATATKMQARFVAEFLDAQTGPSGKRLYSQVASNNVEIRMKSMETAIYDMGKMLKRVLKPR